MIRAAEEGVLTLDKLEAIPGCTIEISEADFIKQVDEVGCAIVGATGDIAPAIRKFMHCAMSPLRSIP